MEEQKQMFNGETVNECNMCQKTIIQFYSVTVTHENTYWRKNHTNVMNVGNVLHGMETCRYTREHTLEINHTNAINVVNILAIAHL